MNKLFKKEVSRGILLLGIILVFAMAPICAHAQNSGSLTVWSFTNEIKDMINNHYKPAHSKVKITFSMTELDKDYRKKLDTLLASGKKAPDVFALEAAFVRKYVESGQLLDLTDVYMANRQKLMQYPVDVGTYNGRVYALSWQATPGAMFYRRSLAKKYLGTDDPKTVQTYFANINKFLDTAKLLKTKSNGACIVVPQYSELINPYLSGRSSPWIVNGKLVIDPMVERFMDMAKTVHDSNYHILEAYAWSDQWYAGMRDELKDGSGKAVEVFAYFLPTWGLSYVLKANAPATSGDWAMIQGPIPYSQGGTWLAAWKNTPNPAAAKELIRYLTAADDFMEMHARVTGDLVSNQTVVDRVKGSYSEPFLGGQNHYAEFAEMAKNVNGKLLQGTDYDIMVFFSEAVNDFVFGGKTMKDALAGFTTKVENYLKR
ncbi:MAG: ABC transporter substrate-binding protein [Treponema sp.]|nr:ABC transporter substrate-binding protein [Treponema sp.]